MIWRVDTGKLDDTRGGTSSFVEGRRQMDDSDSMWKGGDRWMIVTQCECGETVLMMGDTS